MHMNNDGSVNSGAFKVKRDYDQSISVDLARLTTPEATMGATVGGEREYRRYRLARAAGPE